MSKAMHTGAALALTVAIGYAACTLGFWLWPDAAFGSFLYALVVLAAWAFGLGALLGWISGRLPRA